MRVIVILFLILFNLYPNLGFTQKSIKRDSLEKVLQTQDLADTAELKILLWLSSYYIGNNTTKSIKNANKALDIATPLKRHKDLGEAYRLLTLNSSQKGDDMDSILFYCEKGIHHATLGNDLQNKASILNSLGITYRKKGNYQKAVSTCLEALKLSQEIKDTISMVNILNSIAVAFFYQDDLKKAKKYFQESKKYAEIVDFKGMIASTTMNLGNVFSRQDQLDSALVYYQNALELKKSLGHKYSMINNYQNIADIYIKQKQYEMAHNQLMNSYDLAIELQSVSGQVNALEGLGNISLEQKKYREAVKYGKLGLKLLGDKAAIQNKQLIHGLLYTSYAALKNYPLAYEHLLEYQTLQDSLHNNNQTTLIHELETKYQVKQKETENELLKAKEETYLKTIQSRNTSIIAILLGLLLIISWSVVLYISKLRTKAYNQRLEQTVEKRTADLRQANYELRTFNYIASHDIKEPIRNIGSYVGLIQRKLPQDLKQNLAFYFDTIKQSTNQLYTLIEDFARYTTLSKDEKIALQQVNLSELTHNVVRSLEPTIKKYKGQVLYENLPLITSSSSLLFTALKNLIENGLKYNEAEQPTVQVLYEETNHQHKIIVSDNGIGIEQEYHNKIFEMFKRLHNKSKYDGSGIGLAIVKLVTEKLNGTIIVESNINQGSSFIISLPK